MDYTVIYPTWVQTNNQPMAYACEGIPTAEGRFHMPVNAILPANIENGSHVRVVILESTRESIDADAIADLCRKETESVLSGKDCQIEISIVKNPFSASRENMGRIYKSLLPEIVEGSTVLADVTYGPKYIPLLIFSLLSYAERFLGCEVESIIYGQVFFDAQKKPYNPQLFDITSIYLLSSFSRYFGNSREEYDRFLSGLFPEE